MSIILIACFAILSSLSAYAQCNDAGSSCVNPYTTCISNAGTDISAMCSCIGTFLSCFNADGCWALYGSAYETSLNAICADAGSTCPNLCANGVLITPPPSAPTPSNSASAPTPVVAASPTPALSGCAGQIEACLTPLETCATNSGSSVSALCNCATTFYQCVLNVPCFAAEEASYAAQFNSYCAALSNECPAICQNGVFVTSSPTPPTPAPVYHFSVTFTFNGVSTSFNLTGFEAWFIGYYGIDSGNVQWTVSSSSKRASTFTVHAAVVTTSPTLQSTVQNDASSGSVSQYNSYGATLQSASVTSDGVSLAWSLLSTVTLL